MLLTRSLLTATISTFNGCWWWKARSAQCVCLCLCLCTGLHSLPLNAHWAFKVLMWQDRCRSLLGGCCCCRAINRDSSSHIQNHSVRCCCPLLLASYRRQLSYKSSPLPSIELIHLAIIFICRASSSSSSAASPASYRLLITHTLRNTFTSTKLLVCV